MSHVCGKILDVHLWASVERERLKENERHIDLNDLPHEDNTEIRNLEELVVTKQSSSTCKVMLSGDTSCTSAAVRNTQFGELNTIFNKAIDDISGDTEFLKVLQKLLVVKK